MPIKRTALIPGYFYHIYNRAVADNLLFSEERNYFFFLSKIKKYLNPISDILAYCLMPNHYHLIVKIKSDGFSASMHKLALSYVVSYNKIYNRKGHLFLGPFQRILIKNLSYLLHLSRYIHINPVKENLVITAEEWKFSSYSEYIGLRKVDFINPGIVLDLISDDISSSVDDQITAYKDFIQKWDVDYMKFVVKRD